MKGKKGTILIYQVETFIKSIHIFTPYKFQSKIYILIIKWRIDEALENLVQDQFKMLLYKRIVSLYGEHTVHVSNHDLYQEHISGPWCTYQQSKMKGILLFSSFVLLGI